MALRSRHLGSVINLQMPDSIISRKQRNQTSPTINILGGDCMANPGLSPNGAIKKAKNRVSRTRWSDWNLENVFPTETKDRKSIQIASIHSFGAIFKISSVDIVIPSHVSSRILRSDDDSQKRVGHRRYLLNLYLE